MRNHLYNTPISSTSRDYKRVMEPKSQRNGTVFTRDCHSNKMQNTLPTSIQHFNIVVYHACYKPFQFIPSDLIIPKFFIATTSLNNPRICSRCRSKNM